MQQVCVSVIMVIIIVHKHSFSLIMNVTISGYNVHNLSCEYSSCREPFPPIFLFSQRSTYKQKVLPWEPRENMQSGNNRLTTFFVVVVVVFFCNRNVDGSTIDETWCRGICFEIYHNTVAQKGLPTQIYAPWRTRTQILVDFFRYHILFLVYSLMIPPSPPLPLLPLLHTPKTNLNP